MTVERITHPDVTPETVREHLRDAHGDSDWQSDINPMSLHALIHSDPADLPGQVGWQQDHLHPEYPLTWTLPNEPITSDGVTYTAWTDGYAVGFKATHEDGRVEYVYLNPSGESDDGVPTVFLYQGPSGAAHEDDPLTHTEIRFDREVP